MKVVDFNRSPHKDGNTYEALKTVSVELENQGIEVRIVRCVGCRQCARNRNKDVL